MSRCWLVLVKKDFNKDVLFKLTEFLRTAVVQLFLSHSQFCYSTWFFRESSLKSDEGSVKYPLPGQLTFTCSVSTIETQEKSLK